MLDDEGEQGMPEFEQDPCEVCNKETAKTLFTNFDGVHQLCPRCGEFKFTGTANSIHRANATAERRAMLSGWVREQNGLGLVPVITSSGLENIISRPLPSISDRAMALLVEASRGLEHLGDRFNLVDPRFIAATYSVNPTDVNFLMKILNEGGLAKYVALGGLCEIEPEGYLRLDELKPSASNSSIGFVAMWFDEDLNSIYTDGFEQAVFNAGYNPIRIDKVEHVNKIDDEIIRQINASKFVVADFTGHRGGVYFEAGYAIGMGLPVFWTCRKDHLGDLHFDIRQFNCIDWESSDDLASRLSTRIEAVLGPGPNK